MLCHLISTYIRPVFAEASQKPVGVQPLYLIYNMLEQVVQFDIGGFQTSLEAQMEQSIIGVHPVIVLRIFFPDLLCVRGMEPCGVLFEELLHVGHLQQTLVEIAEVLVPDTGAAFFHRLCDHIHINDMVTDLRHQLAQDNLVDARETLRCRQIINRQFFQPLRQMCFIFHIAGHVIKLLQIITVQPLRHQLVAVRLMRNGKELFQPCQKFRAQCARRSCQQKMNCQLPKIRLFLCIATALPNHCPESFFCTIIHKTLIDWILRFIQPATKHVQQNFIGLCFFYTAERRHHCHVQLCRSGRYLILCHDFGTTSLCTKKLPVVLHQLAHRGIVQDIQFLHPVGNSIRPVAFAV